MSAEGIFFGLGVIACIGLFSIAAEIKALRLQMALSNKEAAAAIGRGGDE